MKTINKVAVIGAGVMGSGIAAQIANAGVDVLLLDIVPKGEKKDRSVIAKGALEKLKKANPAALMHPKFAKRITPGNLEDDIGLLKECDWVVEAIIENVDIKRALYKNVWQHLKRGAVLSSNTSTLPMELLMAEFTAAQRKRFMITHFFNPPRYMRLMELVTHDETDKESVATIRHFADVQLGKTVVDAKDTPGFIANRIGTFWLHAAVTKAIAMGVDVEAADAVLGRPAGVPKTGVFGLLDLVGIDLMPHVLQSMTETLGENDAFHALGEAPALMNDMIKEGYTGRKGKGGFYRLNENKKKEVRDLKTGAYYAAKKPKPAAVDAARKGGLRALVTHNSLEGRYAWAVLSETLYYAAHLVGQAADNIVDVDEAMKLGYNWKKGPFELIDELGSNWFAEKLIEGGKPPPRILNRAASNPLYKVKDGELYYMSLNAKYERVKRPDGVLLLEDIKRRSKPLLKGKSASVWDIGDKVVCLEFHSKMNSLNPLIISTINKAIKLVQEQGYKGMVIYNEGPQFSVGANILMLLITSKLRLWFLIRYILSSGQKAYQNLKYAPFPVVGAPSGMALGGGCEVLLHCDALEAHAESYIGLVEAGVGIVPGWGGCKELLGRGAVAKKLPKGPMPSVSLAFENIATAKVAKSAAEAKDMLILREGDGIVMNKNRVLAAAKARVLALSKDYTPPKPFTYKVAGASGRAALDMAVKEFVRKGVATPHDAVVAQQLANVLTGGKKDYVDEVTEADILRLEREAIVRLAKTPKTRDRIAHILKTGKPLRN